ncbi:MAG: TRAP transporter small permease subunit [Pseudomonadota bacterium]|nr:TRAP transporter small permease subunit [Pseudomonadota bacterium]|tara:strand:+ start:1692 stop:2186 length:495 start_codon:yes stop_codon:yes gene_type:complete
MKQFQILIDKVIDNIAKILTYLLVSMIILVFITVIIRYMLNISYVALQELVMYFHALIFMFGVSYALKEKSHVKIDIIYNSLSKKNQYFISMLGTIIFIIPTSLFITYSSIDMVTQSWSLLEGSSEAGGLDLVFILKSVIPITGVLIFLQALSDIIKYVDRYKT